MKTQRRVPLSLRKIRRELGLEGNHGRLEPAAPQAGRKEGGGRRELAGAALRFLKFAHQLPVVWIRDKTTFKLSTARVHLEAPWRAAEDPDGHAATQTNRVTQDAAPRDNDPHFFGGSGFGFGFGFEITTHQLPSAVVGINVMLLGTSTRIHPFASPRTKSSPETTPTPVP